MSFLSMCPVFYVGTDVQAPPALLTLASITLGRATNFPEVPANYARVYICIYLYLSTYLFSFYL